MTKGDRLFVVRPHSNDFDNLLVVKNLINQSMLNIDPT